jgi:hypothetical protein
VSGIGLFINFFLDLPLHRRERAGVRVKAENTGKIFRGHGLWAIGREKRDEREMREKFRVMGFYGSQVMGKTTPCASV